MTDVESLLEEWEGGKRTGIRPARAQVLRMDLMEATDLYLPHRRGELEAFLDRMRGQITRRLRERVAEMEEEAADY